MHVQYPLTEAKRARILARAWKAMERRVKIKKRTGLPIHRVELIKVDFLRDVARIHAFYYSKDNESTTRGMGADDE